MVLKWGEQGDEICAQNKIVKEVRKVIGVVASFKEVLVVNRLPKMRSGKILRLLGNIADDYEYKIPSIIDDIAIISKIETAYMHHKVGRY